MLWSLLQKFGCPPKFLPYSINSMMVWQWKFLLVVNLLQHSKSQSALSKAVFWHQCSSTSVTLISRNALDLNNGVRIHYHQKGNVLNLWSLLAHSKTSFKDFDLQYADDTVGISFLPAGLQRIIAFLNLAYEMYGVWHQRAKDTVPANFISSQGASNGHHSAKWCCIGERKLWEVSFLMALHSVRRLPIGPGKHVLHSAVPSPMFPLQTPTKTSPHLPQQFLTSTFLLSRATYSLIFLMIQKYSSCYSVGTQIPIVDGVTICAWPPFLPLCHSPAWKPGYSIHTCTIQLILIYENGKECLHCPLFFLISSHEFLSCNLWC